MSTKMDIRQSVLRSALNMAGTAANASVDGILIATDPLIGKLFEDRNILLTDGGTITFTGTQVQFTEALNITLNQKISGAVPQVITLGSTSQTFTNSGDMWVAVINRTAGTATSSIITAGNALPAVSNANQEVFLIAKRVDAGDGTQRLYWRNGFAQNAGQTLRLGQGGGTGSGVGGGSDLNSLTFRAQFIESFTESTTSAVTAVNGSAGFTNAVYSAAKQMFTINYDANVAHTMNTTGTAATLLGGSPAFTVAAGDVVINLATNEVKKITAISSQTAYTLESAFTTNLSGGAICLSQAVHTKDIYNYNANATAASLAQAFPASTFAEIMVDYEDNATSGSNLWTPDTTPFAAYVGSTDNTNWMTLQTRITNETDTMQSDSCPTSGSSLYLRFFANKSSGSGFVNLLNYEAFMQKSAASTQGGTVWSAYAVSNSSTTAINCTLSIVGGKTTITFTNSNQYAVGQNSGQSFGVLDVYLNGQMIPRFVSGSVPTTDGYYTELSQSAIQLDQNYSSLAVEIQVVLRTQIVDASTQNVTNISTLKSVVGQNISDFVNMSNIISATSTTGSPAAGSFYSTVVNRASMPDFSQDLKVRFGIERMMIQALLAQSQTEIGSSQEAVWVDPNDFFNRVRFVGGGWYVQASGGAGFAPFTATVNDYVEFVFYGTGVNLIDQVDGGARDYRVSIDGGAETTINVTSPSSVLNNRNYDMNVVRNMANGLTLGVHTLKIRNNATAGLTVFGFEVLQSASTLAVQAGIAYQSGTQLTNSAAQSLATSSSFETGTLGTRGGRVIVYQKSDGTINKAVTPTNTSQANLTSADHTNEEIVRSLNWREFGAGRTDDFSTVANASTNRAFTLEDDTTTLVGSAILSSNGGIAEGLAWAGAASFVELTFIGTGLDLQNIRNATITDSYTITVDGTAITTNTLGSTLFGAGINNIVKIVSGLPYGQHVVRITTSTSVGVGVNVSKFIVYQPKTPSLPSGAVELARYNILATYATGTTQGTSFIATGVLRKNAVREVQYQGTWSASGINSGNIGGLTVTSSTTGDSARYTFFGTGFEFRLASTSTSYTFTMNIDGTTTLNASNSAPAGGQAGWTGALTTGFYGTGMTSFVASSGTGTTTTTPVAGNGVSIQGLTLGWHTVIITKGATGATTLVPEAFDIITPTHGYKFVGPGADQNVVSIGSQGIEDTRKMSLLARPLSTQKAWAQAIGITSGPTTTATSAVPMPDMSCTVKTSSGRLGINFSAQGFSSGAGLQIIYSIYVDGVNIVPGGGFTLNSAVATDDETLALSILATVSPGTHIVQVVWWTNSGTLTMNGIQRVLTVEER